MQEPTHILTGVLIQRTFERVRPRPVALGLTAVCAFLSHGLLDRLANATYHPPSANLHDPFWVCFHLGVLVFTVLFCVLYRKYWWGFLFAGLPDLDWVFIHGQQIFRIHHPFYTKPYLHNFLHVIFDETPPFSYLKVPNHRQNSFACLYEVGLIVLLLAGISVLSRRLALKRGAPSAP